MPLSDMAFIDSSAFVRRYVTGASHDWVVETMGEYPTWCASALTRAEVLMALHDLAPDPSLHDELARAFHADWDTVCEIPVDDRCLARAAALGALYRLRTVDAIHLAAADRLPAPIPYVTLDRRQIPAASQLGFAVVSPAS